MNNTDRLISVESNNGTPRITILDKALVFITHSMDPVPMIAILFALSVIALIMNMYYKDFFVKEMMLLIFSAAIPIVIGSIIKNVIGKPRPNQREAKIIIKTNSSSWPSTHAAVAVGFYGFLAFLTIQSHLPIYIIILCAMMIILISYSRIHLNVHFLQDILGGLGLGLLVLTTMVIFYYFAPKFAFSIKTLLALVIVSWFFIINYYRKYQDEIPEIILKLGPTIKRILTGSVVFIISFAAVWIGGKTFFIFMTLIACAGVWEICMINIKKPQLIMKFFGVIVVITMVSSIILLRELGLGKMYAVIFILCSSISDISGYFIGKYFGSIKIFGAVSPNKTLEGLTAAIFIPSVIIGSLIIPHCNLSYLLIVILSISAITGDYLESLLKRKLEIKDFSNFLPGHGGILDRVDSALFTGFVFYLLIQLKIFIIH